MSDQKNPQDPTGQSPNDNDDYSQINAENISAKVVELENNWQRAVADLANFRRQAEEDQQNFAKFAAEKTILAFLPILDNLKRATEHCPDELQKSEYQKGIMATISQFEQALTDLGVTKTESRPGTPVDPTRHQAIGTAPGQEGEILKCFEEGYELGGKVIRLAKVQTGDGTN